MGAQNKGENMNLRSDSFSNTSITSSSFLNSTSIINDTDNNCTIVDFNDLDLSSINNNNSTLFFNSTESLITDIPNSIHNLVKNVNYKKKSTTTSLLSINSTSTVISLNGPTSKDIPPIKLTHIENIPTSYFNNYLDNIDDYYDNFNSSKSLTSTSLKNLEKHSMSISRSSLSALNEEQEAMLDSNNLSNVPEIYFNEDFRLDNPRIFNKVIENTKFLSLIDNELNNNQLITNHELLQEKLSSYLDIVEVHLIHEISKSSENFFSALDDLKKITTSSKLLTDQLKSTDSKLIQINKLKLEKVKKLINLLKKYQNIEKFNQILIQIKTILNQADLAEYNYFQGNYDKSLQLIDSVFALIKGNVPPHPIVSQLTENWKFPLKDLNKLPALSPLKRLLSNLITDTGKSYAKLFSNYLIDDLRLNYENINQFQTLQKLLGNTNKEFLKSNILNEEEFSIRIVSYLKGLIRCGELSSAFKLYEEKLSNELKSIFKSNLPSNSKNDNLSSNKSDDSKSTSITNNISNALVLSDLVKNMTPKEFENMLVDNYTKFSEIFKRLIIHKNLLLTSAIDALNNFDSQILKVQPDIIMDLDITNSINLSINSIQRRMAKLIKIREQQNSFISLNYFLRFYKLNLSFLNECEIVSKGMLNEPILKDIINRQLVIFIQQFHRSSVKRCIEIIEKETWRDDGLSIESQQILDLISKASDSNVENDEWIKGLDLSFQDYNLEKLKVDKGKDLGQQQQNEIRKTLTLHSQNYILPSSVGIILGTLKAYLLIIHSFKNNTSYIIPQNYLPELLKAINLKIHQSVLGAQATKTAGLKHVTTKHLALACEVCRFWCTLVTDIERACLSEININNNNNNNNNNNSDKNQLDDLDIIRKNIMKEFEEVRGLFNEQVIDVHDKLVAIMKDTMLAIVDNLNVDNFINTTVISEIKVNSYMEQIVKKTLTIARSVQRYLPSEEYDGIMIRIFDGYEKILTEKFVSILEKSNTENKLIIKSQIVKDMRFFEEKLDDIDNNTIVNHVLANVDCHNIEEADEIDDKTVSPQKSIEISSESTKVNLEITRSDSKVSDNNEEIEI